MSEVPDRLREALAERYRIVRELGQGGSATVYLAEDLKHGRQVALKVLREELAQVLGRDRFLDEIRTTARLEHPHILSLHDSGETAGYLFYVMPYIKEESLRERLDRVGQLPIQRAVEIARDVAKALEFAHSLGIIHRDVKPENILLPAGQGILADFGISKAIDESRARRTEVGLSLGTVEYMSPEQAAGDEVVDMRSDIYSLGAVMYEMLVGQPPFRGKTAQIVLGRILTVRPARPKDVRETLPEALDGAIMRALSRLPADRFSSVEHFAEALVTVDRRRGGREGPRRLSAPALAAGAVILAAMVWTGSMLFSGRGADSTPLPAPRISPFVTGSAILKEPAWSPSGNLVAYVSDEAGNEDVWVADPSGANALNLTGDWDGIDVHPSWSPDGQRVAFVSARDGGGLFSMSALGGDVRRLADVSFDGNTASKWIPLQWAGDGSLVYTSRDETGGPQVYRLLEGATAPDCLTCSLGSGGGHSGHLLPGETLFVFRSTHGPEPAGVLYLADLSTGETREIGRDTALPHWNAVLSRLFFVSTLDGGPDLWALEIDIRSGTSRGVAQRVSSGLDPSGLGVGPDGGILVARTLTTSSLWSFPLGSGISGLAEGTQLTPNDEFADQRPRWLPGGEGVVFESNRRGGADLWLLDVNSGQVRRLTSDRNAETSPRPSPDGSWVAFERTDEDGATIRLIRTDGSGETVPDSAWANRFAEQCCVSWAPDGRSIALSVVGEQAGRRLAIASIEPSTGAATEIRMLEASGDSQERPRFSPDGRFIAYEARGEGSWDLWVVDAEGSNPRRITSADSQERQAAWSPDQQYLYYIDDFQDVWRVPLDVAAERAGQPEMWFDLPTRYGAGEDGIDIQSGRLLMAVEEFAGDIWLVEFPRSPS